MIFETIENSPLLTGLSLSFLGGVTFLAYSDHGLFSRFRTAFYYVFWPLYAGYAVWSVSAIEHFHRTVSNMKIIKNIDLSTPEYNELKAAVVIDLGFGDAILFALIIAYIEILNMFFKQKDNKT